MHSDFTTWQQMKASHVFAIVVVAIGVAFEVYLRRRDHDRREALDASQFLIDNDFYNDVDWWSDNSTMRGEKGSV